MDFIWPETTLVVAIIPLALILLCYAVFARYPSPISTNSKALGYNIPHLMLTCIVFNLSSWTLIDWLQLQKHLQPLSGFVYCPYEFAGAEIQMPALGIVKFEFTSQFEMLLVGSFGLWVSLWEARTSMRISHYDGNALLSSLKQPFFYASPLALWATAKAWWDIRNVADGSGWSLTRTYFAGDARNHHQASDDTQVKRCTPEAGACHVLQWHGLSGRGYPTIDLACQESIRLRWYALAILLSLMALQTIRILSVTKSRMPKASKKRWFN